MTDIITVSFNRSVFGVPVDPKHTYLMQCTCGDADTTPYKKGILVTAREHKRWHDGNAEIIDNARRN